MADAHHEFMTLADLAAGGVALRGKMAQVIARCVNTRHDVPPTPCPHLIIAHPTPRSLASVDVLSARGVLEEGATVLTLDTSLLELGGGALRQVLCAPVHVAGEVEVEEAEAEAGASAGGGVEGQGQGRAGALRVVLRAHILRPAPGADASPAALAAVLRRRAAFLARSGLAPARGESGDGEAGSST